MNRNYFLDADTLAILQSLNSNDESEGTESADKLTLLETKIRDLYKE